MKPQHGFFITGTDTGVGKTLISCAIIHELIQQGHQVIGMKPVAAGAEQSLNGLRNEDALELMNASYSTLDYKLINPYCYEEAIAPHIAADLTKLPIDLKHILSHYQELRKHADMIIVEGAGGWLVPINAQQTLADLAIMLDLPVILVVGIRLGCLNHALLTQHAIKDSGLPLAGWVANIIDPDNPTIKENISYLTKHIESPLLGITPYQATTCPKELSEKLTIGADMSITK